jgi:hypothetical protein
LGVLILLLIALVKLVYLTFLLAPAAVPGQRHFAWMSLQPWRQGMPRLQVQLQKS